jgi:hypothetical protein
MCTKNSLLKNIITALLASVLLVACASPQQPQPAPTQDTQPAVVEPAKTQPPEIEPTFSFVTHEGARDIAVAYLEDKYGLETTGDWIVQDETPQNLVGSSAFLYTSGEWVVFVQAPVVAPEYLIYTLKIDHTASGLHWEGELDADGTITETMVTPPTQ